MNDHPLDSMPTLATDPVLALLGDLAKIFADPAKLQSQIAEFKATGKAAESAIAKLAAAQAAHDAHLTRSNDDLLRRHSAMVGREEAADEREARLAQRETAIKERQDEIDLRGGRFKNLSGTITQEFNDCLPAELPPALHRSGGAAR